MHPVYRKVLEPFVSLQLTVLLLAFSMVLVFVATLDQVNLGIWAVQDKYIRSFFVFWQLPGIDMRFPVFPGGYLVGGLLLINLIASHFYRFKLSWKKSGIVLTHFGLIILLIGELATGLLSEESLMRLDEGETKNYSESYLKNELAIIDTTDAEFDRVVSIPERAVARKGDIETDNLPFSVRTIAYFPNSSLVMRNQAPHGPPSLATAGVGPLIVAQPLPLTYRPNERNMPAAFVEIFNAEGSLGTWLVSPWLTQNQEIRHDGRTYEINFRSKRFYKSFSMHLITFSHDRYAGTNIPKNFSSLVRLRDPQAGENREALIYMNNPLRFAGFTFYQSGFDPETDATSFLQVVRNPGWLLPYLSCVLMGIGLTVQFSMHLFAFVRKRALNVSR